MRQSEKPGGVVIGSEPSEVKAGYRWPPGDMPVAWLVWIATGAVLLPVLVLAAYGFNRWTSSQRAEEVGRVLQYAENLGRAVDRELKGYIELAEVLAASRHLQQGDIDAMDELARDAATRAGGHIFIVDRSLRQVVNTRAKAGTALPKTANEGAVQRVFDTGESTVGNLGPGAVVRGLTFSVRVPVRVGGEIRYVLGYAPRPEAMLDLINQTYKPPGWFASIVDGTGRIVARSERHEDFFGAFATAVFLERSNAGSGLIESTDLEGRPSVTAFQVSKLSRWRVAVWAPKALMQEPGDRAQRLVLGLMGLALLASIAAAWLVGRAITGPTRQLVVSAQALGAAEPVRIRLGIMREANIVGRALAGAAEEIASREARMRDSEARFRNMADHAPVMIWVSEPDGAASFLSASWYEFTGQTTKEGLGFGWLEAVHPGDREAARTAFDAANLGRRAIHLEYRLRRADGTWRWVVDSAQPRFSRHDRFLGYIGSVMDITERKQHEEHVHLLLREVNHRSKNMLGLVMAVARQTLASDPTDFVSRFSDRIQAMAASQDLLVRNDWQGADLHELARTQLAHFADLVGSRIVLDGPVMTLLPAAAQSIGMAVHELATNAGKYGALSGECGRVEITWRRDRVEGEQRFCMRWAETGGPEVAAPRRRGFGSTVIDTMVRMGLKGNVTLDFAPTGLIWQLECPAELAIDPRLLVKERTQTCNAVAAS